MSSANSVNSFDRMHKRILKVRWQYFELNKNVVKLNLTDTILAVKSSVVPGQFRCSHMAPNYHTCKKNFGRKVSWFSHFIKSIWFLTWKLKWQNRTLFVGRIALSVQKLLHILFQIMQQWNLSPLKSFTCTVSLREAAGSVKIWHICT